MTLITSDPADSSDDAVLRALAADAATALRFPVDAHVVGEPLSVTRVHYAGHPRVGLRATCRRGDHMYDVGLADVVFAAGSEGARLVARYRAWAGLDDNAESERAFVTPRPHKAAEDDITVGEPVELIVLVAKSNALRCRLLGSAREVTVRTAVRDEISGSIITLMPKKQWTHARHPYVSGEVTAVRFDASVLGLVPLTLRPEDDWSGELAAFELQRVAPGTPDDPEADLVLEALECIDDGDVVEANALLAKAVALDIRCLEAHAVSGDRVLRFMPTLALHHYELGVSIGSLTVGHDFDGVLPWELLDNQPFLRCLHGLAGVLQRRGRSDEAVDVLRRLLRLDPGDHFGVRAQLDGLERARDHREHRT